MNQTNTPTKPSNEQPATTSAQWLKENKDALESSNQYVEQHGLPLAGYRKLVQE